MQTFPPVFNLEFFSEHLVEESGNNFMVCHGGEGSCTLPLKFFPDKAGIEPKLGNMSKYF